MSKTNITEASGITPELMQKLNEQYNSSQLRAAQTKLTSTSDLLKVCCGADTVVNELTGCFGELSRIEAVVVRVFDQSIVAAGILAWISRSIFCKRLCWNVCDP
ncbi:hypothetical protein V2K69_10550 [Pseudomonas alliivorans]|nr:hypothetical protein [Pseudomonas alliivorans]MEE4721992.1 hypothetical protein [Pseudomonas alliivorans]MEE4757228.1 hypothetical protein [Pseudomonas alliivorans]MEE4764375.1 hypothetical protein [Pseudomonas alliivorans]MEE4773238.1 hypothetical protein [Pseudomonas alliivorans]